MREGIEIVPGRIVILAGGPSPEATISRRSADAVAKALIESGFLPEIIELEGNWITKLQSGGYELAWPVLHGNPGEDGSVQGTLALLGIPFIGSDISASAVAIHKQFTKAIANTIGVPIIPGISISKRDSKAAVRDKLTWVSNNLVGKVCLKPYDAGSSIGVEFIDIGPELAGKVEQGVAQYGELIIEQYLAAREITVGILERAGELIKLPVIEITTPEGGWYDYKHKYTEGLNKHIVPAPLDEEVADKVTNYAQALFTAIGARDFGRVDFMITHTNEIFLLEINTIPGLTGDMSLLPDAASGAGISFTNMVAMLVNNCRLRCACLDVTV